MDIIKFNEIKHSRILYCILDNLDSCESGFSREVTINVSDFFVHSCVSAGYDVFVGKSENELLKSAVLSNFYTHAVVVSTGTYFGLSRRLFSHVETLCSKDFFIAGHILDREENYIELHHQFYIVNLSDYTELNCPLISQGSHFEDNEHTQIEPVMTRISDSYVLSTIEKGTTSKTYKKKLHGWDILTVGLDRGKKIIDLGKDIRSHKHYLYNEYDHVFVNNIQTVYYNQFFCHNFFAAWNSDSVHEDIPFVGPVEQYATVGIGLNWIRNLVKMGFVPDTKIIFTDINQSCLLFMKALVTTWDGKDYSKFYSDHMPMIPNEGPNVYQQLESVKLEFEKFKSSFDCWEETWREIKTLSYEFILIDYTSKYNFNWLMPKKNTLLNISDLFNFGPFAPFQGVKYRVAAENRFLQTLKNVDPDITLMVTSRAAKDFIPNWGQQISKVKDFELTDINLMKKLPWHIDDWSHTGTRPFGL